MFCAVQPCNTSSTVGAGSVASCLTPAASVFCTLLARQSVCTGGQSPALHRGNVEICRRWRRQEGEGACLKWVVSFRLTAELAVCREEREQSSPDNDNTLYICRPGQCQRRNCGGSDGNRTSIYRDSFDFNKTVELTAWAPVSLQSNWPIYPIRHL